MEELTAETDYMPSLYIYMYTIKRDVVKLVEQALCVSRVVPADHHRLY